VVLRPRLGVPLLVVAALAVAPSARAEPSELQRARALFDEAGELEVQGQWGAAQDRLRAALAIRETPHLRYALGWALENGGRLLEARAEYEVALRLARRDGVPEVSRIAATRVAEVERKIPFVQLRVRGVLAKDTRVLLDGRDVPVNPSGGAFQVDPGTRTIRIERTTEAPRELSFSVAEGALRVIDLRGDDTSSTGADAARETHRKSNQTFPWILVGTGGALAIGGALLFVSSVSDASTRDDSSKKWCDATACANGAATLPETPEAAAYRRDAYDASSRGNTKQIAGAVVGGLGFVGLATGTYLLLTSGDRKEPRSAARRTVEVQAAPLQGGAIAGATLTF
jgi:hypothetical protein